tara:strand:+ start:292 stop:420 length:129 start_codon:yes stop_codon:yes gene_type:complete
MNDKELREWEEEAVEADKDIKRLGKILLIGLIVSIILKLIFS